MIIYSTSDEQKSLHSHARLEKKSSQAQLCQSPFVMVCNIRNMILDCILWSSSGSVFGDPNICISGIIYNFSF